MSAQTARTAGPWVAGGIYVEVPATGKDEAGNDRLSFFVADCENRCLPFDECAANAAFIVQACNAHDDLVAALSKMIRIARHESDPRTIREACREAEILLTNVARAALAKAGALS